MIFPPQLYNHLPSSRDHNRSFSRSSTYTRRTRLRIQQQKPNNSGCYWHQSLNTYLVRFGCPLLTKLVGYRRSNKVIYCCRTVWGTSEPDQKLAAQSPPLLQAGTGASFLYLSTPPPPPFPLIATRPRQKNPTSINPSPPSPLLQQCSH